MDELGTERLSWVDLMVFIEHSPRESAMFRELNPEYAEWGVVEHLLAASVDALNVANWQRQGRKNSPKPKPVKRPGSSKDRKFGTGAIPVSEFKSWWDNN